MKGYRLRHRITHESKDIEAGSAQEACQQVGWLIGETWVRERTWGAHAHGWRNVTKRDNPTPERRGTKT